MSVKLRKPRAAGPAQAVAVRGETVKIPMLDWQRDYLLDESRLKFAVVTRQGGKSFAGAMEDVLGAIEGVPKAVILSAGQDQSNEVMMKVQADTQALGTAAGVVDSFFEDTSLLQKTATFPNGSRIIALPANPRTARGHSANVRLDEAALQQASDEIWAAMYPTITRGYKLRVTSTFYGTNNRFYKIARDMGLEGGSRPEQQPVRRGPWSGHWVDIFMVAEQAARCPEMGLKIDPAELREGLGDEDIWMQEYCNVPLEDGAQYIPLDLVLACESDLASLDWDGQARPGLCAGWDFARKRDRSVIVIGELVAGLLIVRGVIWLNRLSFAEQEKVGRGVARSIQESDGVFSMDAGGNGAQIAETLQGEFTCMDAVNFGSTVETGVRDSRNEDVKELVKVRIARDAKRRFEENGWRLPESRQIRTAVAAIKRSVSPSGNVILDAARTDKGHGDEFWALALLNAAVTGARAYTPIDDGMIGGRTVLGNFMEKVF